MLFQLTGNPTTTSSSPNTTSPPSNDTASTIFSTVLSSISSIPQPGNSTTLQALDFTSLTSTIPATSFYAYNGSLTTPPCSEGVTFLMATEPLAMPVDTFNAMKQVVKFNSRFAQNALGEQNLLQVSRIGLEAVDASQWSVREGVDVVPMPPVEGEAGKQKERVLLVVHSRRGD